MFWDIANLPWGFAGVAWAMLPGLCFCVLQVLEWRWPLLHGPWRGVDVLLNGSGLLMQGLVVPLLALALGQLLAVHWPHASGWIAGSLPAFLLSFVGLDLLYYAQHRWFHGGGWAWHRPHHSATRLGVWVTARGALFTHLLMVYLLPSALLAYFCQDKLAYFAGSMLTASLDLWRHSAVRWPTGWARCNRWLGYVLITPTAHHWHHQSGAPYGNFGANLVVWDKLFGTYTAAVAYPEHYGVTDDQPVWRQWLLP